MLIQSVIGAVIALSVLLALFTNDFSNGWGIGAGIGSARNGQIESINDLLRKYLLRTDTDSYAELQHSKKPILWIHVPYAYNSRNWLSFGSRSSMNLNQPYLYLTVRSIIAKCEDNFKICIIDDTSFARLLPRWEVPLDRIAAPISGNIRQLGLTRLIYEYGGMLVPISFLCFRDLKEIYERGTGSAAVQQNSGVGTMFACENINRNITATNQLYAASCQFMGAPRKCPKVREFISYMEQIISTDMTAENAFLGRFDQWCDKQCKSGGVKLIAGTEVGTRTLSDEPMNVEMLLGQGNAADYSLYREMSGIWIPAEEILRRTQYSWFARLSQTQVFECECLLCRFFILANIPGFKDENITGRAIDVAQEAMQNKPQWISFWKTPLVSVWGQMPQNLGNNVRRQYYPEQ